MSTHTILFRQNRFLLENNYAVHRAVGNIPGCVPAVDVLVPWDLDVMRFRTNLRAEEYIRLSQTVAADEWMNHPFHRTDLPVSEIRHPCKPYQNSYT